MGLMSQLGEEIGRIVATVEQDFRFSLSRIHWNVNSNYDIL